jgi:hypothetical protein
MMLDLETWLTQFAAGAGPLYVWDMIGDGMLRTWIETGEWVEWLCPLEAQITLDYGLPFPRTPDATQPRLGRKDRRRVIAAADNGPAWMLEPALRQRLLRLCGLHDVP